MAGGTTQGAEQRSALEAARAVLGEVEALVASCPTAGLAGLMGLLDDVAALASAGRASVAVEVARRGEAPGAGLHAWVREHAPSLRQGGAGPVARLAVEVSRATPAGSPGAAGPDPGSPLGLVWDAVRAGHVDAGSGCAVLREASRLTPLLRPDTVPTVATALVGLARSWDPAVMRRLRPHLLAEHGHDGALDDLQERLAASASLSTPRVESGDLTEYQLLVTRAQAATLKAAIGPLSAPAPTPSPVSATCGLRGSGASRR